MKITNKKNALRLSCAGVAALAVLMIVSLAGAGDYPEGKQLYFKCVNDILPSSLIFRLSRIIGGCPQLSLQKTTFSRYH